MRDLEGSIKHACNTWSQCLTQSRMQGMDQLGPTLSSFPDWIYNDLDKAWVHAWRQRPGPRYTLRLTAFAGLQLTSVMLRACTQPADM